MPGLEVLRTRRGRVLQGARGRQPQRGAALLLVGPLCAIPQKIGRVGGAVFAPYNLCWVLSTHQCNLLSNGRDSANDRSSCNALSPSVQSLPDSCSEPCECPHSGRVLNPLYERVQSQRPGICCPICPMCLPNLGSCCHSASVIPFICNAEITRVVTFDPNKKTVQEACCGRRIFY